jgi:hypothetical protein
MSNPNPYSAPSAELTQPTGEQEFALHAPRTVNAGQGIQWLVEGFNYFKQDAGIWIAICIIGFVLMMVFSVIPVVNILIYLTTHIWMGGLMIGCKAQYDREPLQINHLFAGFREPLVPLLILSVGLTVVTWIIMLICLGSAFLPLLGIGGEPDFAAFGMRFLLGFLIAMALLIPIAMAGWFAAPLIALHKVPVFQAITMSFQACLKNIVPFLLYGIVLFGLGILTLLTFGLGMLVLGPVIYASIFVSYKDIFVDE